MGSKYSLLRTLLALGIAANTLLWPVFASASSNSANACKALTYPANWVSLENAKVGDLNWEKPVKHPRFKTGVVGWFDATSSSCGQQVGLHLSGNSRPTLLQIFRMGYYQGTGARLVFSKNLGKVVGGSAAKVTKDVTHLITTSWPTTSTISIDKNFPTGIYMARFDDGGPAGYAPLIIRNDVAKSKILLEVSTLTWQAYNTWGGWSLYHGPNPAIYSPGREVSFDRPYDNNGQGEFDVNDQALVKIAESMGLDISYTENIYASNHPSSLLSTDSVIYDGHSEYWTTSMQQAAFAARSDNVNLLFFGANSAYWRSRLKNNDRTLVVWKGSPTDPFKENPELITNKWGAPPNVLNQSELVGQLFAGFGVRADYKVKDATRWPVAGTGLTTGALIKDVVGNEVDSTNFGAEPGLETILNSQVNIKGSDFNVAMTYYTTKGGAGVIDAGTNGWVCGMTLSCSWKTNTDRNSQLKIQGITENILRAAAVGPLGLKHPENIDIPPRTALAEICDYICGETLPEPES